MSNNQYFYKEEDGKFLFLCEDGEFTESVNGFIPHSTIGKQLHIERTTYKATEFAKAFELKLLITHSYMDGVLLRDIDTKTGLTIKAGYNLNKMEDGGITT